MSKYNYNGTVFSYGKINVQFEVYKFCIGKLHRDNLISKTEGISGAFLSPNYLQSVFEIIANEKVVTILKKVDYRIDPDIKRGLKNNAGVFALHLYAVFNAQSAKMPYSPFTGTPNFAAHVTFGAADIIYQTHLRERGSGNFSVFTIKSESVSASPLMQSV